MDEIEDKVRDVLVEVLAGRFTASRSTCTRTWSRSTAWTPCR